MLQESNSGSPDRRVRAEALARTPRGCETRNGPGQDHRATKVAAPNRSPPFVGYQHLKYVMAGNSRRESIKSTVIISAFTRVQNIILPSSYPTPLYLFTQLTILYYPNNLNRQLLVTVGNSFLRDYHCVPLQPSVSLNSKITGLTQRVE